MPDLAPRGMAKALAAVPALPHIERRFAFLLPHRGFLWRCRLLPGSPLPSRRIEGIFDGLACVEPYCLAGCDFDGFPGSWIPPLACGPRRHIEIAKAGDTDHLAGQEAIENGVYHGLHRLACRRLVQLSSLSDFLDQFGLVHLGLPALALLLSDHDSSTSRPKSAFSAHFTPLWVNRCPTLTLVDMALSIWA